MGQPACKLLDIPGTLLLDWDDPLRADHYRVWLFIVGTDTEFHALICRMSRMGPMASMGPVAATEGGEGPLATQREPGIPGVPSEVTLQQLNDAITGTSANSNAVGHARDDGERSAVAGQGTAARGQDG